MNNRIRFNIILLFCSTLLARAVYAQSASPGSLPAVNAPAAANLAAPPAVSTQLEETRATGEPDIKNPFIPQIPRPKTAQPSVSEPVAPLPPTPEVIIAPPAEPLPPPPPSLPRPSLTIAGIVWGTPQPQAIINHEVVGEGDKIDQWLIERIDETGIVINNLNQTYKFDAP